MKKTIFFVGIILSIICNCAAQEAKRDSTNVKAKDLIGVWLNIKEKNNEGQQESFRFLVDKHFTYFFPSSVNRKFATIKGTYAIANNEIRLKMTSYIEVTGGKIVTGGFGASSDLFEINKSLSKEIFLKNAVDLDPLFLSKFNIKKGVIMINSKSFVRVLDK